MRLYSDSIQYHAEIHSSETGLPHLLLLHGFMGSSEVFSHLIEPLSQFCNPVTIDLAGHGKTETPGDHFLFKTERQVAQMHTILERFSFENLYAYGYSMGGRLLFQLIAHHQNFFKGALIESSHCGIQSEKDRKKRIKSDDSRALSILENYSDFVDQWMELPLFEYASNQQKKDYSTLMKYQNPKLMAASLRGFGAGVMPSVCEKLQNLRLPLYLVAGRSDPKYVKLMTAIAENIENCTLTVVENAGHRVHADQPEKLTQIINSFIKNTHV
jgi:2-succinyl-6-hydroxy-2,4-cyclohexadiene-1-carboxylate synthase